MQLTWWLLGRSKANGISEGFSKYLHLDLPTIFTLSLRLFTPLYIGSHFCYAAVSSRLAAVMYEFALLSIVSIRAGCAENGYSCSSFVASWWYEPFPGYLNSARSTHSLMALEFELSMDMLRCIRGYNKFTTWKITIYMYDPYCSPDGDVVLHDRTRS